MPSMRMMGPGIWFSVRMENVWDGEATPYGADALQPVE